MNAREKINLLRFLFIFALVSAAAAIVYAESDADMLRRFRTFTNIGRTASLVYRLYIPDTRPQRFPLIVCLHGVGERGNADTPVLNYNLGTYWLRDNEQPCMVAVPLLPDNATWVRTDIAKGSYALADVPVSDQVLCVMDMIRTLTNTYAVDGTRIYLVGLSIGGFGVWDMLARYPDVFAAGIPMSGGGDPSQAERINSTSLWVFHGEWDIVVPVTASRAMVRALSNAGCPFQPVDTVPGSSAPGRYLYTEYPRAWHIVWDRALNGEHLRRWLFRQRR